MASQPSPEPTKSVVPELTGQTDSQSSQVVALNPRKRRAEDDYSTNPVTVKNRRDRAELSGVALNLSLSAAAERTAKSKARKRFPTEVVPYWKAVKEGDTNVKMPLRITRLEPAERSQEIALVDRWLAAKGDEAIQGAILEDYTQLETSRRDRLQISHAAVEASIQKSLHDEDRMRRDQDLAKQKQWLSTQPGGRAVEEAARRKRPSREAYLASIEDEADQTEAADDYALLSRVDSNNLDFLSRTIRNLERNVHFNGIEDLRQAGSEDPEREMEVFYQGTADSPLPERQRYTYREGTVLSFPGLYYKDEVEDPTLCTDSEASSMDAGEEIEICPYEPSSDEEEDEEEEVEDLEGGVINAPISLPTITEESEESEDAEGYGSEDGDEDVTSDDECEDAVDGDDEGEVEDDGDLEEQES